MATPCMFAHLLCMSKTLPKYQVYYCIYIYIESNHIHGKEDNNIMKLLSD